MSILSNVELLSVELGTIKLSSDSKKIKFKQESYSNIIKKCILLCAGYATRLFPITKNFPKALLEIEDGKPLLNYIMDQIDNISDIDEIYLITNDRYYNHFINWKDTLNTNKKLTVLNDYTTNNDDKLGAVGDLKYTKDKMNINDDVIIIAGDNLFDYNLQDFIDYYKKIKKPVVTSSIINDIEQLKGMGVALTDSNNRIIELKEKSANPISNKAVFATYIYPKEVFNQVDNYLNEGNNPDAPGYFLEYVVRNNPTYIYNFNGNCYDVGTHDSLKLVRELYNK